MLFHPQDYLDLQTFPNPFAIFDINFLLPSVFSSTLLISVSWRSLTPFFHYEKAFKIKTILNSSTTKKKDWTKIFAIKYIEEYLRIWHTMTATVQRHNNMFILSIGTTGTHEGSCQKHPSFLGGVRTNFDIFRVVHNNLGWFGGVWDLFSLGRI